MAVMPDTGIDIGRADEHDLDGMLELLEANQIARGGCLSVSFSRSRLVAMMGRMPLVVARRGKQVVGFIMNYESDMSAGIPIICAMLDAYPGRAHDAYVYGPICVAALERGKGVAQAMFAELRRLQRGREGVLFIRSDNEASIRSHRKMGMREVSGFSFGGVEHKVLSYIG